MPTKTVSEIRTMVRNAETPSFYGAIRLICSSDAESASAVTILEGGGGYSHLRDAGLSTLEATRCVSTYLLYVDAMDTGDIFDNITENISNKTMAYLSFLIGKIKEFDNGAEKAASAVGAALDAVLAGVAEEDKDQIGHIIMSKIQPSGESGGGSEVDISDMTGLIDDKIVNYVQGTSLVTSTQVTDLIAAALTTKEYLVREEVDQIVADSAGITPAQVTDMITVALATKGYLNNDDVVQIIASGAGSVPPEAIASAVTDYIEMHDTYIKEADAEEMRSDILYSVMDQASSMFLFTDDLDPYVATAVDIALATNKDNGDIVSQQQVTDMIQAAISA